MAKAPMGGIVYHVCSALAYVLRAAHLTVCATLYHALDEFDTVMSRFRREMCTHARILSCTCLSAVFLSLALSFSLFIVPPPNPLNSRPPPSPPTRACVQQEERAHAVSVENLIGDTSPEPPPLGRLSSVEKLHLLQQGRKSAAGSISNQLDSSRSTSVHSSGGYGGGARSRSGSLISPPPARQQQHQPQQPQQQPMFSALMGVGTAAAVGGDHHASSGGMSIDRLSIGASVAGESQSREEGVLSMAGEAALFWEVSEALRSMMTS